MIKRTLMAACVLALAGGPALHAQTPAPPPHERVIALERGSNFRDVGGYATTDGRHVRWGLIFRSGATPLLTPADVARVKALGLANMVDLRSDEERVLAPTRIDGVPYAAVGYPMAAVMGKGTYSPEATYRNFPELLAPQLRIVFRDLLSGRKPIAYNCSAGQDRTGFATAIVLSALGVARPTIYQDYLLSTQYRHPENELPPIDAATAASNPTAGFFAKYQHDPHYTTPAPLYGPDKTPYLSFAFDEIDKRWGSVDGYLEQQIGISHADVMRLRGLYLE